MIATVNVVILRTVLLPLGRVQALVEVGLGRNTQLLQFLELCITSGVPSRLCIQIFLRLHAQLLCASHGIHESMAKSVPQQLADTNLQVLQLLVLLRLLRRLFAQLRLRLNAQLRRENSRPPTAG